MDWTQAFAIIGSTGAFVLWAFSKLDNDIKNLSNKVDTHINTSNQRVDQLYQMFIDLLKEGKK